MQDLFIIESIEYTPEVFFNLLFDKDMNLRELVEAYLQIKIKLDEHRSFIKTKKFRYVVKDKIITFDKLLNLCIELIRETIQVIKALDTGINLVSDFYLEVPGLDNTPVEIRKALKRTLENINEYKLQPYIIKLYTILTSYKGTDTLQQRKYQKMIEDQEYAMKYRGEL